jgi:hypothetical protein
MDKEMELVMTTSIPGELEIDVERGVIYFHTTYADQPTLLRICKLKFPNGYEPHKDQVDITLEVDSLVSYGIWGGRP